MKMQRLWVRIVRAVMFFIVSIVFFSIKFYDISLQFQIQEGDFLFTRIVADPNALIHYFDSVFNESMLNTLLGIVFIILGGTELIGVKKNGN